MYYLRILSLLVALVSLTRLEAEAWQPTAIAGISFWQPASVLNSDILKQDTPYSETTFERFQVVFFISLPFVLITQFALVSISHWLVTNDTNLQLEASSYAYLGMASILTSATIAAVDAHKQHPKTNDPGLHLSFFRRF